MVLGENEAYCTGCGKPRPIVSPGAQVEEVPGSRAPGQKIAFKVVPGTNPTPIDPRYPTVLCGSKKRPGLFDFAAARRIIKDRRARKKARRAAIEHAYPLEGSGGLTQRAVAMRRVR